MAHFSSVLVGSLLLATGIDAIAFGMEGLVSGLAKWIGGMLIFTVLALVSVPAGLLLRWFAGKLPLEPLTGSMAMGACVGVALIFVLHPATYPQMSFISHPVQLLVVHGLAGLAGGWVWHFIEFKPSKESVRV
ncbi:hypothetical protein [uncultured Tateyamaria sp.]|uniref:hypothetical protein n=1 Tax=uncultured Tateyamaria sp. TaxID=455651 RepID=UPI0026310586|nr:hypothetical protein [uncultured Tateyamaria sp.]